ncbi:hypothetical protein ABK040_010845 [Willaertia magna]
MREDEAYLSKEDNPYDDYFDGVSEYNESGGSINNNNMERQQYTEEFRYFGIGPSPFLYFISWIFSKITFGIAEAIFLLPIKKTEIEEMIIAGRKLKLYLDKDSFKKVFILCIINNVINNLTGGLWYVLGFMHLFYFRELDKRIYWEDEFQQMKLNNNFKESSIVLLSAYPGIIVESITFILTLISNIFCLGILNPWIKAYYYKYLFPEMKFGNSGLKLNFTASGNDIFKRYAKGKLFSCLTFGIFACCASSYTDSFLNRHIEYDRELLVRSDY